MWFRKRSSKSGHAARRVSHSVLCLEQLESRDAPATLVGNNKITYQDIDGDDVTISFSKSFLTVGNVINAVTFNTGFVDGSNTTKQQLKLIDLTSFGAAATAGTSITVTAARSSVNGGDGFAAVGRVNATNIDLGTVTIDGDLGRILAGDQTMTTSGLKGLTVQSMGRFGTSTGAPDLNSLVFGKLEFLKVKSDVKEAFIHAQGGVDGRIGSVFIGGSLIGGASDSSGRIFSDGEMGFVTVGGNLTGAGGSFTGAVDSGGKLAGAKIGGSVQGGGPSGSSGRIQSSSDMGFVTIVGNLIGGGGGNSGMVVATGGTMAGVKIGGSVQGGAGVFTGRITASGDMGFVTIGGDLTGAGPDSGLITTSGKLAGVKIGGSVQGGSGDRSGRIISSKDMGPVTIVGNLIGGVGEESGEVQSSAKLAGATIGGSVLGGVGFDSGLIVSSGDMGFVTIGGNLTGGSGAAGNSGAVFSSKLAGIKVGGSVRGGAGIASGIISAVREAGSIAIGGDVVGGTATGAANLVASGFVGAKRIANLTIGGSLIAGFDNTSGGFDSNGAIRVVDDLGTVLIYGSIIGNSTNPAIISARGKAEPTTTGDVAIGSLRVLGRVELGLILAGVDTNVVADNADAQIGHVIVGGDWIASSIAAGAVPGNGFFGDTGDAKMSGGKDDPAVFSKIASVTIGGQVIGTLGTTDHFGIVAENIGAVRIGGTPLALNIGNGNDDFPVGFFAFFFFGDFRVNEI